MRGFVAPLIKLIIFLVITSFATYVLAATINNQTYGSTYSYTAEFTDATGLQIGDDVRIAGVRVGTVDGISVVHANGKPSYAKVNFSLQQSARLSTSVIVRLRYRNLVGQRYLDIEQGAGNPNDLLPPNAVILESHTQPAVDLTVLFQGFRPLTAGLSADQINQLSLGIIQTLQGEGGAFDSLLQTIADLTNTLADKDQVIGQVIDNLSGVLTAVNQHDGELSDLIIQLRNFVSGLAADRTTIGNAIDGINNLATTTAGLLTQVRAPLAKDIQDITGLVSNLNANHSTITYVIQQLPPTVAGLIRTASYGSWFNFYLCSASAVITYPGGVTQTFRNIVNGNQKRCG